jgi:hypothetical protein
MPNTKRVRKASELQDSRIAMNPWYVTHGDLLALAAKHHCRGIVTKPVLPLCRPEKNFWVFKATLYKSSQCQGFVGYGYAHPGNVSPLIFNHAEMRMAETRAVNRDLRKAYGAALGSLEELPPWSLSPEQIPVLCHTVPTAVSERSFPCACMRPAPIRHTLGNWPALLRTWIEKS